MINYHKNLFSIYYTQSSVLLASGVILEVLMTQAITFRRWIGFGTFTKSPKKWPWKEPGARPHRAGMWVAIDSAALQESRERNQQKSYIQQMSYGGVCVLLTVLVKWGDRIKLWFSGWYLLSHIYSSPPSGDLMPERDKVSNRKRILKRNVLLRHWIRSLGFGIESSLKVGSTLIYAQSTYGLLPKLLWSAI